MQSIRFSLLAVLLSVGVSQLSAQELEDHLIGGEFSAALDIVDQLAPQDRDQVLAQIATAQGGSGETAAARGTIGRITSPARRDEAVEGVRGAGGGSFADFQSLIDLIQTTVVPDTWEALGGPSTMREYAQGVYVDAEGTVRDCETFAKGDAVADLKSLLRPADSMIASEPAAWREPAKMRCVSLQRLLDQRTWVQIDGTATPQSMTHMAGLSHVQYLFIDDNDIVIAGPVGGIDSFQGYFRDRQTGRTPLRLDFFATCLASALGSEPFGCTIDPTTEGLQRAAAVARDVQADRIPIGKAAEEMIAALGMQRVEVFGTAGDTPIGYLMVEADRHMKNLALGVEPMPRGARSYVDVIDATIDRGPPDELLLRLWFTSSPRPVRADADREVFELAGTPIRLSGQNERALASGQRGQITQDFRTEAFVSDFNKNWHAIRTQYPIYSSLESIYRAASVAELLRRFADTPGQRGLLASLASGGSGSSALMPAPRQVESIATLHSVRKGRKVHHVLLASGGVAVNPRNTLTSQVAAYPSLSSIAKPTKTRPRVIQRWWWDAR